MQALTDNARLLPVILMAAAAFGTIVAVGWPWLVPPQAARRLRDVIEGRRRVHQRQPAASTQPAAPKGLQTKPSALLSRLVAFFRGSERLDDGRIVRMLQQAGYRGRPAAVKFMAVRILAPIVFLAAATIYVWLFLSQTQPLWIQAGAVLAATALGYFLPMLLLKNRIDKRKIEIGRAWPDAVDLLLICVETGMSIEHAFKKVAEEMGATSIELAKEMSLTNAELSYLQERRQAYENLSRRIDLEAVQAVSGCLIQSEKYGTSLGVSLRVLAQESREMRMAAAEKKAAALPPKLTVPMIIFFLPVLFAVIITPAALQILSQ